MLRALVAALALQWGSRNRRTSQTFSATMSWL